MSEAAKVYPVPDDWAARTRTGAAAYAALRDRAARDPEGVFGEAALRLAWSKPFTQVKDVSFAAEDLHIRWFADGELNASANCIDRWLDTRGDETAIVFEGDDPADSRLDHLSANCTSAGVPHGQCAEGARRGQEGRPDHPVSAHDPARPPTPCWPAPASARCIRSCSAASRPDSLSPAGSRTAAPPWSSPPTRVMRGGKTIPLKANVDAALEKAPKVDTVLVIAPHRRRRADEVEGRDVDYAVEAAKRLATDCPPEPMNAEDPLVHPLHLGLDRKAQGRAAHHGRIPVLGRRGPTRSSSTTARARSSGAPPTWAGSRGTATWSMGRWRTAATTLMFEGVPNYPDTSAASGRWWTSTRSRSSTPPPRPCAP